MARLNRLRIASGVAMYAMMAKDALADLLNGDYAGVAVNLGLMTCGLAFYVVARVISTKFPLARSLRLAFLFLAIGTSAFVSYDLVHQIGSYREGDEGALVGIISDVIYVRVAITQIGVEVAEVFSLLEGVSSMTGSIGAAHGAVVFVVTDVFSAIRRASIINGEVPLSFWERLEEGVREFIGLHPGRLVEELLERKELNDRRMARALQDLKRHLDIRRYVVPTGKLVETCQNLQETKGISIAGESEAEERSRTRTTATTNVENCKIDSISEPNSVALFDREIDELSWDRSVPEVPESIEMFCFDGGERGSIPARKSYFCENAMGITDLDPDKIDGHTLINLEDGDDTARGFDDSPNIFLVGNGVKWYHGGDSNDTFLLSGDCTRGGLFGGNGTDTLDLTAFAPEEDWVETRFDVGIILQSNSRLAVHGIEVFTGRKSAGDEVYVTCAENVEYVDGQGGGDAEAFKDHIHLLEGKCAYDIDVNLPENTLVRNHATKGNFRYHVIRSINGKSEVTTFSAETDDSFFFQYSVADVTDMKTVGNATYFELAGNFNVTVSGARSYDYRFEDADVLPGATKGGSYVSGRSSGTVESAITAYLRLADKMANASFVVRVVRPDEIVAVGNGNRVMSNDPSLTSHLIGNRGENVFVINPTRCDVKIYNFNQGYSTNTVDLRRLNAVEVKMESYGNDLVLTASGLNVTLENGTRWYGDVFVVLRDNPMKISSGIDGYYLTPHASLAFDESVKTILISGSDVEENTEIITPGCDGAITFARDGNRLVLTNVFDGGAGDTCTIILSDFYTTSRGKMSTLCVKFARRGMCLKDHAEEIDDAENIEALKREYDENDERLRTWRMIEHFETLGAGEDDTNPRITYKNDDANDYGRPSLSSDATMRSSFITDALNWAKTKTVSFLPDIFGGDASILRFST